MAIPMSIIHSPSSPAPDRLGPGICFLEWDRTKFGLEVCRKGFERPGVCFKSSFSHLFLLKKKKSAQCGGQPGEPSWLGLLAQFPEHWSLQPNLQPRGNRAKDYGSGFLHSFSTKVGPSPLRWDCWSRSLGMVFWTTWGAVKWGHMTLRIRDFWPIDTINKNVALSCYFRWQLVRQQQLTNTNYVRAQEGTDE